ncbi:hypothetical protein [Maricaulis sp.]|uniref:super-infection exclusion protein B n=1 Tax=Maricaulis sp. TaxID=1486257 RepID=UPI000C36A1DB|nr:hypothetical protein [Maricaulis sp.]MAC89335.1 hypothetical protein [Maricaulis sp.]
MVDGVKEAAKFVIDGLTKQPAVLFFGSITLLALLVAGVLTVPAYSEWVRFGLIVIAVLAGWGLIARLGNWFKARRERTKARTEATAARDAAQQEVLQYLDHLDERDRQILAYLLEHNDRVFQAASDGGYAAKLVSTGIIKIKGVHGQQMDMMAVPFEVPGFVWNELQKRRDQFPYTPEKGGGRPWVIPWGAR